MYSKISTDPGLLKIWHSHRFVAVVVQILISFGRGLFGVHLLILHFKSVNFPDPSNLPTFHIFLNLTYSLRKKYLFPKMPKNHPKITQNRRTVVNEITTEI